MQRNWWLFPAEEGIDIAVDDVPGVVVVGLATDDCDHIPRVVQSFRLYVCERGDVLHFCGRLARSPRAFFHLGGLHVPEGVAHCAQMILSHQTTNVPLASHPAGGIRVADDAPVIPSHQPTNMPLAGHAAGGIRTANSAHVIPSHQAADILLSGHAAAGT